jgi:asparagine synthase (glutamine-hydrolysing)
MCGIFAILNNDNEFPPKCILDQFQKGRKRGPEFSGIQDIGLNTTFGFHRLAINGLDDGSNQPIIIDKVYLICNGEIYNHSELAMQMGIRPQTNSDCEIIIHLYIRYGIQQTLAMLDGVFAFVLCDMRDSADVPYKMFIARDPYGVRPLYSMTQINADSPKIVAFASEIKMLAGLMECNKLARHIKYRIAHFLPGTYQELTFYGNSALIQNDTISKQPTRYHHLPFSSLRANYGIDDIFKGIQHYFNRAIEKRYLNTDRPVACLLSGGLDSSSVVASINELHKRVSNKPLETYSIGIRGSEDLRNARIVADYLGTKHTEIFLKEEDFFNAIKDTIYNIETFDTTTVRASIPNSELCRQIALTSEAKVIFNGDGADELFGGYIYEYKAPDAFAFDADIRRLLDNIYKHDVRRSDGSISSHGLEPRTPFLDRALVQFVLSIDPNIRFHVRHQECEKYLFRRAFSRNYCVNSDNQQLLPDCILWRTKEAFSDGVSGSKERSLFQILQEQITKHLDLTTTKEERAVAMSKYTHLPPYTDEQYYYRTVFEEHFPDCANVVSDFWMPRFVQSNDPSARTLAMYSSLSPVLKEEVSSATELMG